MARKSISSINICKKYRPQISWQSFLDKNSFNNLTSHRKIDYGDFFAKVIQDVNLVVVSWAEGGLVKRDSTPHTSLSVTLLAGAPG